MRCLNGEERNLQGSLHAFISVMRRMVANGSRATVRVFYNRKAFAEEMISGRLDSMSPFNHLAGELVEAPWPCGTMGFSWIPGDFCEE